MNPSATPVAQVLESYRAAVHAKDVEAFVALYDADVQVFDMWGQWSLSGIAAWRAMVGEWFGSLGTETVRVGIEGLRVEAGQDVSAAHAFLTFTGVSAQGKELRSMTNRLTMVFTRTGAGWKIAHEHTSAPIDHATLKAILQRAPAV
jgi:ketosteroid isomerase-like protein